jgi:hypothetical protein
MAIEYTSLFHAKALQNFTIFFCWKIYHLATLLSSPRNFDYVFMWRHLPTVQGGQMSLLKNCPECSPTRVLLKLVYTFYRGKKYPTNSGGFSNFPTTDPSNRLYHRRKFANLVALFWSQSYDHELQRQLGKNLQRN